MPEQLHKNNNRIHGRLTWAIPSCLPGFPIIQKISFSRKQITVINTGQLELEYSISAFTIEEKREVLDYCAAQGGGDEYISKVEFGDISNSSGSSQYADYTNLSTTVSVGDSYSIVVTNGNPYSYGC